MVGEHGHSLLAGHLMVTGKTSADKARIGYTIQKHAPVACCLTWASSAHILVLSSCTTSRKEQSSQHRSLWRTLAFKPRCQAYSHNPQVDASLFLLNPGY